MSPLLEIRDVRKDFPAPRRLRDIVQRVPGGVVHAVDGVSLEVGAGQTVGLVGESGSGKTTLGRMVLGLLPVTSGTIVFDGEDITSPTPERRFMLRKRIQVVFQDPYSSLNPRQTVGKIIREPLDIHNVGSKAERRKRVRELMDVVALPSRYFHMYPHELSGGLRQRVSIATALALAPTLIIADEPVSALDVSVQAQILDLFESIRRESGISMLFISHDLGVVHQISDAVAVMWKGKIVECGTVDQVYRNPQHVYTKVLLSAIPPADPTAKYEPLRLNESGTGLKMDE